MLDVPKALFLALLARKINPSPLDAAENLSAAMATTSLATTPSFGGPAAAPYLQVYCNAPTVTRATYQRPAQAKREDGARLINVVYVQRHFRRTPDNFVPNENAFSPPSGFDCSSIKLWNYMGPSQGSNLTAAHIYHNVDNPTSNPFHSRLWNGTCDNGQLTPEGLQDSINRGQALASIYGPNGIVPLLNDGINEKTVYVRTSPEERTFMVSGGVLSGMGHKGPFRVNSQSSRIDGIVPSYSCSRADDLRTSIEQEPAWKEHLASKSDLFNRVLTPLGVADDGGWTRWIDHSFDFLASRQCHGKPLPAGITDQTAAEVYDEGSWEYDYIWNKADGAEDYVRYSFGGFNTEFAQVLSDIATVKGASGPKLRLYIGHDGTMVRLFKTLAQSGQIRWPALGSDLALEVWKLRGKLYVRMLSYGKVFNSDAQLLTGKNGSAPVEWTPIEDVISHVKSKIPADLVEKCN